MLHGSEGKRKEHGVYQSTLFLTAQHRADAKQASQLKVCKTMWPPETLR